MLRPPAATATLSMALLKTGQDIPGHDDPEIRRGGPSGGIGVAGYCGAIAHAETSKLQDRAFGGGDRCRVFRRARRCHTAGTPPSWAGRSTADLSRARRAAAARARWPSPPCSAPPRLPSAFGPTNWMRGVTSPMPCWPWRSHRVPRTRPENAAGPSRSLGPGWQGDRRRQESRALLGRHRSAQAKLTPAQLEEGRAVGAALSCRRRRSAVRRAPACRARDPERRGSPPHEPSSCGGRAAGLSASLCLSFGWRRSRKEALSPPHGLLSRQASVRKHRSLPTPAGPAGAIVRPHRYGNSAGGPCCVPSRRQRRARGHTF